MAKNKSKIIIATHQPNYIPWLGYFYKVYQSDTFVFLDDVQFIKKGMQNYHYVKTPQGSLRLKFPVSNASRGALINEVVSKDELGWKKAHLKTLKFNYSKAPYFNEVIDDFTNLLENKYSNIAEMNSIIIEFISKKLGINTTFINSSKYCLTSSGESRILDICEKLKASVYYSGTGAKNYQEESNFKKNGIALKYSKFKPVIYKQLCGEFQPNVSIIDYLMHCGYDWERVLNDQI